MKKLLLFVAVLAAAAACVNPAIFRGKMVMDAESTVPAAGEAIEAVPFTMDLKAPTGRALVIGDRALFDELEGDGKWVIELRTEDGELGVECIARPSAFRDRHEQTLHLSAVFLPKPTQLHMPDGSVHPQQHLVLRAELEKQPFWRWQKPRRAVLLQELVADTRDGAVDSVTPTLPAEEQGLPYARLQSGDLAGLPARFCGSAAEQELQRMLYRVAAMHNAEAVQRLLPGVRTKAHELIAEYAAEDEPWPDCWGRARSAALDGHRRILPYLLRVQKLDCFGSAELAEFINSGDFARMFGESWRDVPAETEAETAAPEAADAAS